jgi:hypothetical protein
MHWQILVQFLFRLSFGLAAAMAVTSPRQVNSGFFRAHLWVAMGLDTFLAAVVWLLPEYPDRPSVLALAVAGAVLSYLGTVLWLYERTAAGWWALWGVGLVNILGMFVGLPANHAWWWITWQVGDGLSAGSLLGMTLAAMLLGHWYLNTPTMKLAPLQRLVAAMAVAVLIRAAFAAAGLGGAIVAPGTEPATWTWAFVALRWLAGLVGVLAMTILTWQTLKIPNTQSATGIMYVAVIFVFLGELTSQFLSSQSEFPL